MGQGHWALGQRISDAIRKVTEQERFGDFESTVHTFLISFLGTRYCFEEMRELLQRYIIPHSTEENLVRDFPLAWAAALTNEGQLLYAALRAVAGGPPSRGDAWQQMHAASPRWKTTDELRFFPNNHCASKSCRSSG